MDPDGNQISARYPAFKYSGPYNVTREDLGDYEGPIVTTEANVPPLESAEFDEVYSCVKEVLARHGNAADNEWTDFYLYDDKYFDRTQKVELYSHRFEKAAEALINDLQLLLEQYPLWRVWFITDMPRGGIIVYPNGIRLASDHYTQDLIGLKQFASDVSEWNRKHLPDLG